MHAWTLLALATEFCKRQNLPPPLGITSAQDEETRQIWGLLNEEVAELNERGDWPQLHWQHSFTHEDGPGFIALGLYGPTPAFAEQPGLGGPLVLSATIKYPTKMTIWCDSLGIPVAGPLTDQEWSYMLKTVAPPSFSDGSSGRAGTYYWRMSGRGICIYPGPPSGAPVNFSLDAQIREPIINAAGDLRELFENDTDMCLLPGRVVLAGLRWRWRAEKGLPYAEHQRMYETLVVQELGNAGAPTVHLADDPYECGEYVEPGLLVLAGSWPLRNS